MQRLVRYVATHTSHLAGNVWAFVFACTAVLMLVVSGGLFGYSDHWLALFSALLSAVTFLLVFLLQYRESRDTTAVQLKLNELLRAVEGAREHQFLDIEHLAQEEQEGVLHEFRQQVLKTRPKTRA